MTTVYNTPRQLSSGTRYGNRTHLFAVKGRCPEPIDEPSVMVDLDGFEPSTNGLKVRCSNQTEPQIQLEYYISSPGKCQAVYCS